MLGKLQQSIIRIEIPADASTIADCLLRPDKLQKWLLTQNFSPGLPDRFYQGFTFTSWSGPIAISHYVDVAESNCLRMLLSQGIDGFHEWYWGEGWVQSRIEGISLLPLNLGQTLTLLQLKQFLVKAK